MVEPPSARVADSVRAALAELELAPVRPLAPLATAPGRAHRQAVRATVSGSRRRARHDVAVRVLLDPDTASAERFVWEHRVAVVLGDIARRQVRAGTIHRNPIPQVLHDEPVPVAGALVAVSRFVPQMPGPVTATVWGETLGLLHVIGSTPEAIDLLRSRPVPNTLAGLDARTLVTALARPDHPLRGQSDLVITFAEALRRRALRAVRLDPVPVLAHRDLHGLNCVNAPGGGVAIDWEEAGWGSRSDDFAWVFVLGRRFGGSRGVLQRAIRAYAQVTHGACPTARQIAAAGHVRELLCLGYSIQNAYRSPAHFAECLTELPILHDPDARTGRWRALFNPAVADPGLVA